MKTPKQAAEYYAKNWGKGRKSLIHRHFLAGFAEGAAREKARAEKLVEALKFYSLKSNYSVIDEGRNYNSEYVTYELNETTYADEELGTRAREALQAYRESEGKT